MAFITNISTPYLLPDAAAADNPPNFIAPHTLFGANAQHPNTNPNATFMFPPYLYDIVNDPSFNASFYHELSSFIKAGNASLNYDCPSIQMPVGNLISMILYAIVCIVGLFGNTLVIYVVLRFSKMQTVTNMYILNLAIADECYLIGIPFLIMTMHSGEWTFGKGMCKAYMVSTSITQFTSSIFLFIMSADRYGEFFVVRWSFEIVCCLATIVAVNVCKPFPS